MIIKRDDMKRMSIESESASTECDDVASLEALFYEDLVVGQTWASPSRPISAEDVETFSKLTGDFDPLHESVGGGKPNSPFGRPIAHGLLGLSVLAGLSTEYPRVATLALVGVTDWQFEKPIFFGDTVHVVTQVSAIQPHGRRAGRVTWLRKLVCEDGRVLQQGNFITLVASKDRKRSPSADGTHVPRQPR